MLAHNARLDNPLPEGTDFSAEDCKNKFINALTVFPPEMKDWFFLALSARQSAGSAPPARARSAHSSRTPSSGVAQRLEGTLDAVEGMPTPPDQPGYFLQSSRDHIEGSIPGLEGCNVCMEEDATLQCSRCKSVKYCGKKCQTKDWKGSHRMRCYAMTF